MPVFRIPGPLRTLSSGAATVPVEGGDLRAAIEALDAKYPGFKVRLLDDDGEPRQFVNLFLNDEDVRLGRGLDSPVGDDDEIAIVPAVAGGLEAREAPASQPRTGSVVGLAGQMRALLDGMPDGKRHFLGTYLRTTLAVHEEIDAGGFVDLEWMERWAVCFAGYYLDALETWNRGERPSEPWRIAFEQAERGGLPPLRNVLLGMNAHINYDLPLSLLAMVSDEEFRDPEVVARRRRDHAHVDLVLTRRVASEDVEMAAAGGGRSLYRRIKAALERWSTRRFLREARSKVWANVRLMAEARARGDAAEVERLTAELSRRSAAKLRQLAEAREVILQLAVTGFGVLLPGARQERLH